ncbi:hypothetical protein CH238_13765 [[Clostridium] leptum DSM 753]|uniref:Uncharacterized protein n=1 Tax=[Clostridium] leptum DSM 753 TaxID=428125 RepID=A0A855A2G0_9FIRM|nr:hypothetical protein CH238_13765 [[Clostridium] leptum DSM 753]
MRPSSGRYCQGSGCRMLIRQTERFTVNGLRGIKHPDFLAAAGPLPCKARRTILYENSRRFFLEI